MGSPISEKQKPPAHGFLCIARHAIERIQNNLVACFPFLIATTWSQTTGLLL
jgi:hypothetical protein